MYVLQVTPLPPLPSPPAMVPRAGGKSTLINLIMRFYDPRSGVIELGGQPLASIAPAWLHRHLGLVAQARAPPSHVLQAWHAAVVFMGMVKLRRLAELY